jgi:hypothetical protein
LVASIGRTTSTRLGWHVGGAERREFGIIDLPGGFTEGSSRLMESLDRLARFSATLSGSPKALH